MTQDQLNFFNKQQRWEAWHKSNPKIWEYFERFTLEAVLTGKKKISHWLIINRIRWELTISTTGTDFKISNNHIAFYARLWVSTYPQFSSIFNTKKMCGEI